MTTVLEATPWLLPYQPALLALAVLCLVVPVQSFLAAPLAFVHEDQIPGVPLQGGHQTLSFRVLRTYSNSVENLPGFGLALLLAVVVGANPTVINWLAGIHLAFRLAFWAVYYSGVGRAAGGPRTLCYIGGLIPNMALAGMAIYALALG